MRSIGRLKTHLTGPIFSAKWQQFSPCHFRRIYDDTCCELIGSSFANLSSLLHCRNKAGTLREVRCKHILRCRRANLSRKYSLETFARRSRVADVDERVAPRKVREYMTNYGNADMIPMPEVLQEFRLRTSTRPQEVK